MMKKFFKNISLLFCMFSFVALSATETKVQSLEQFKESINKKDPGFILTEYLNIESNGLLKEKCKKIALDEIVNWINYSVLLENCNHSKKPNEEFLRNWLTNRLKVLNLPDKEIKNILLVRTLFYPTQEEIKKIENNTNGLKDKLLKKLEDWKLWRRLHLLSDFYKKNNTINLTTIGTSLKRLNNASVDDLLLFDDKIKQNMPPENFKSIIKDFPPKLVDEYYKYFCSEQDNDGVYKNIALEEIRNWINFAAPLNQFFGAKKETLISFLREYGSKDNQDFIDDNTLLVRTLFYPTKEEIQKIKDENSGLKNALEKKLEEWKEWAKKQSNNNLKGSNCYEFEYAKEIFVKKIGEDLKTIGAQKQIDIKPTINPLLQMFKQKPSLEKFKKTLSEHAPTPTLMNTFYSILDEDLQSNQEYKNAVLDRFNQWIFVMAPIESYADSIIGGYLKEELADFLKIYVPKDKNQKETIKNILSIRTLFYPTEKQLKKIKQNTKGLKDTLSKKLEEWMAWRKNNPRTYSRNSCDKDFVDTRYLSQSLKALGAKTTVADLKLFKAIWGKNHFSTIKNYCIKPIIITFTFCAAAAFGLWAFKRFCPHQFSELNVKISSLLKRIPNVYRYKDLLTRKYTLSPKI